MSIRFSPEHVQNDPRYIPLPERKPCSRCKRDLAKYEFHVFMNKRRTGYRLNSACRDCASVQRTQSKLRRGTQKSTLEKVSMEQVTPMYMFIIGYFPTVEKVSLFTKIASGTCVRLYSPNRYFTTKDIFDKVKAAYDTLTESMDEGQIQHICAQGSAKVAKILRAREIRDRYKNHPYLRQCIDCEQIKIVDEFRKVRAPKRRVHQTYQCAACEQNHYRQARNVDPSECYIFITSAAVKMATELANSRSRSYLERTYQLWQTSIDDIISGRAKKVKYKTAQKLARAYADLMTERKASK